MLGVATVAGGNILGAGGISGAEFVAGGWNVEIVGAGGSAGSQLRITGQAAIAANTNAAAATQTAPPLSAPSHVDPPADN